MPDGQTQSGSTTSVTGSGESVKQVVCTSCDGFCPVSAKVSDGQVVKITTREHPLFKGVFWVPEGT